MVPQETIFANSSNLLVDDLTTVKIRIYLKPEEYKICMSIVVANGVAQWQVNKGLTSPIFVA